jgi:hypothetical protein
MDKQPMEKVEHRSTSATAPEDHNKDAIVPSESAALEDNAMAEKPEVSLVAAYFKLWMYASPLDLFLRCIAVLAAAGSGTTEPLMAIVFGDLVNLFNDTSLSSPEELRSKISKNALYLFYLFIGKFLVSA